MSNLVSEEQGNIPADRQQKCDKIGQGNLYSDCKNRLILYPAVPVVVFKYKIVIHY